MVMKIDLHVHTHYSIDSITNPKDLAKKSANLGVIPAVTDHNSLNSHDELRKLGMKFIPGEEVSTDRVDLIGLYLNEAIPRRTSFEETLDRIHAQGGLAYLPHMYDYIRKGVIPSALEAKKIDIIEIFNCRCLDASYNDRARDFAIAYGVPGAVGTDSHYIFEFGKSYTEVPDFDLDNPKALLGALKSNSVKFVAKRAPFYVRGTTSMIAVGKKIARKLFPDKKKST